MTVIVSPDEKNCTHHLSLTDGKVTVGLIACDTKGQANAEGITKASITRTAMKTTTGNQKYADAEPPWSPIAQEDWSGGRGMLDFDDDVTKYWDNWRTNTAYKKIILGPQEQYSKGYRNQNFSRPGSLTWVSLITGSRKYMAVKFTAGANYSAATVSLIIRRVGTPTTNLTVELCADSGGNPDTVLKTNTVTTTNISDTVSVDYQMTLSSAQALTSGTSYWIKAYSAGDDVNCWKIGVKNASGTSKESADGLTWSASTIDLYYHIRDAASASRPKFFKYDYAQYMLMNPATGAPTVYINGDRGVADSNSGALGTLVDASKSWTVNAWAGCIVRIIGGLGLAETKPWRKIVSNTSTALTVDEAWTNTHDTTTEYVILGSDTWTVVGSHGLTAPVTCVKVVNNICFFCQGDAVNIRRMRWYNNSGTATYEWADDGTNKAVFLETVRDATNGLVVWRANNSDGAGAISVSTAPVVAWATANMTFAAATNTTFTDDYGRITNIIEWGETAKYLYVFREATIFAITGGKPDEIPLDELKTTMSYLNGSAVMKSNTYLFFNLMNSIERYATRTMDDVGPNADDGLPSNRQGTVSSILAYPGGKYLAAVNAGSSGYSSIVGYNGTGYNEVYRHSTAGVRAGDMQIEVIDGSDPDRLWFGMGDNVMWIPMPSSIPLNPYNDAYYQYAYEGHLITGYMYAGLYDIWKLYNSVKLFVEGLVEDEQWIEADYQADGITDWTPLPEPFETSPMQEVDTGDSGVTAKRIRFRFRIFTTDTSKTPKIKSSVVETISRVPVKYSISLNFRAEDNDHDLMGQYDGMTCDEKMSQLREWAENLTQLRLYGCREEFDNFRVYIDPPVTQNRGSTGEQYINKLVVTQI